MFKVEGTPSFSEAILAVSTPRSREEALRICDITGTGGKFRAELAARKGDIRTAAAFLAIDRIAKARFYSKACWTGDVDPSDPVQILSSAYLTRAQVLEQRAAQSGDVDRASRMMNLARGYKRQHAVLT